jgi:hypothetical protein|nr:cyclic nucleotide-binding domain-containing protein [Kofleriaceae bacterium]
MTIAFHVSNALYLISYAVKDILWLRVVAVVANVMTFVAIWAGGGASVASFAWQTVFFVINVARLVQLIVERRPVRLSPELQRLADGAFRHLRPRELLRLVAAGEIRDHEAGERVIATGDRLDTLALVLAGTARVELAGAPAPVQLAHGAFLGELAYLTGKPPAADVVAATALRVVRWPHATLRAYLEANPDTRTAVQAVLAADLATKLRR